MKLLEILKNSEDLFIVDDIEDKKTKAAVKEVNDLFKTVYSKYEEFLTFADSQLHGDYHQKLVNLKSLQRHYGEWNGIKQAFIGAFKEEENKINELYSLKATLINKLKGLINDSQKLLPIVSKYHLYNGHLEISSDEHETIIIGNHNTNIINDIVEELEQSIVVKGNFSEVESVEISANYSVVNSNVELCRNRIDELFSNKQAKADKLYFLVENMEISAKSLVFFETYKQTLLAVGCPSKDVDLYEKDLLKKYVPFKKQLQKALKVNFEDISSIVVNEEEIPANDDDFATSYFEKYSPNKSISESEQPDTFAESFDLDSVSDETSNRVELTPNESDPYEMFQLTPSEDEVESDNSVVEETNPQLEVYSQDFTKEEQPIQDDVFEDLFSEQTTEEVQPEENTKKTRATKSKKKVEEAPTNTEEDIFDFYKNEQEKSE